MTAAIKSEATTMGEQELREKYGGKLAKAINRAIRAEVPGGNEALEALTRRAAAARTSRWKDHAGRDTPEAVAYFRHKKDVVDRMEAEVRKRWGVAAEQPPRDVRRRHARPGSKPAGGAPRRKAKASPRKRGA
jgi:hypothetical protein